jgi:hypothetical protein
MSGVSHDVALKVLSWYVSAYMKCPKCGAEVRDSERHCPVCTHDCGYPNVRAAERPEEIRALEERLRQAEAAAAARGCETVLAQFRSAVTSSEAVLNRPLSVVQNLISSDNELYTTFYQLVGMGARRPEETQVELQRLLADDVLFPHYRDQIRFAALSLNGQGVARFGDCAMVLREGPIRDRSTVFEKNSLYFCIERGIGLRRPYVPYGFRATWDHRDQLAAAKLESSLESGMSGASFASVVVKSGSAPDSDDFIEVHIYGPLGRRNIARLVVRKPRQRADKAIYRQIRVALQSIGATIEEHE